MGPAAAHTKAHTPREQLVWIAIGMAAAALATAVYLTIQSGATRDLFVYRVTLLLLFFAISTVSALIFNAKASLGGNVWGMSLALGGPAVLWIVALAIFTRFYPEVNLTKETTLQGLAHDVWEGQQKGGWKDYAAWKSETGDDFADVLGANETETLRNLFWGVYYRAPGQRLESVQITTAFLYLGPKYTVKFQRIRGYKESADGEPFTLYYGGQTSNDTGKSGSVLLIGRDNGSLRVKESFYDGESMPQQPLDQNDVDCLIVSWYTDEVTGDGDYITTDMKEFAASHRGSLRLGIAAFKPIDEIQSWWLSSRTVTEKDNLLPLAFRQMRHGWQKDLAAVEGDLRPWLQTLDKALEPGGSITGKPRDQLRQLLQTASDLVKHPIRASDLLSSTVFQDRRSASIPDAEDVVLSMFLWQ